VEINIKLKYKNESFMICLFKTKREHKMAKRRKKAKKKKAKKRRKR
jgi:hypothetical protein